MTCIKSSMEKNPKSVISIIGTTGVGKSDLGVCLAEALNGEIINADSMQMYKGIPQITNKHPIKERHGIPHHVMNHVSWNEEYDIHRFQRECLAKISEIHERGKLPILVGGTHYYLQSVLLLNKTINPDSDSTIYARKLTAEQSEILNTGSPDQLHDLLLKYDPIVAGKFHPHDVRRVKRALEVYYKTGKPASEFYRSQLKQQQYRSRLRFNTLFLWLYADPSILEPRLDSRVDKMMDQGALTELTQLYDYYTSLPDPKPGMDHGCFQVIGFKEFLPYLNSHPKGYLNEHPKTEVLDDPEFIKCCDEMKLRTRRYARRQVKWIKNTLIPDLQSEEEHNWCHFGKVYILNATDLSQWNELISSRALPIAKQFIETKKVDDSISQVPLNLQEKQLIRSSKSKFDESKWKQYTCNVCIDKKTGKPQILIGDQYEIHMKSRRHKRNVEKQARHKKLEKFLKDRQNK